MCGVASDRDTQHEPSRGLISMKCTAHTAEEEPRFGKPPLCVGPSCPPRGHKHTDVSSCHFNGLSQLGCPQHASHLWNITGTELLVVTARRLLCLGLSLHTRVTARASLVTSQGSGSAHHTCALCS